MRGLLTATHKCKDKCVDGENKTKRYFVTNFDKSQDQAMRLKIKLK